MPLSLVRRLTIAILALPLLLGGCAEDEPEPKMPTTSPPTASATETEPTVAPEPWDAQTEDGAIAFAEHWVELLNSARLEFQTERLAEASTPECGTCSNYVRLINKWRSTGVTYKSKPWSVEQVGVISNEQDNVQLALRILRPTEIITQPAGGAIRNKGTRATYAATFHWLQGGWRMHELVIPE